MSLSLIRTLRSWGGLLGLIVPMSLLAQPDSVSIPLDTASHIANPYRTLVSPADDFFHRYTYLRIPLGHPANGPLNLTDRYAADRSPSGLVAHLVEGLRLNQITAVHPRQRHRAYRYTDLFWDLIDLQGLPDTGYLAPEQIDWAHLEQELDLLHLYRVNRHGQEKPQVAYLGLIWHPMQKEGSRVLLAIFPFSAAADWLGQLRCQWVDRAGRLTGTSARRYLETRRFLGYPLQPEQAQFQLLPPDDRSRRPVPDWYDQH